MPQLSKPYSQNLHYGASKNIIDKANELRKNMTSTEMLLWQKLNKHQLKGFKFRRQHPINIFIADFYCHQLKLVIEIDGGYHNTKEQVEYDNNRTAELERFGITVIRFTNEEIQSDINSVTCKIEEYINCSNTKQSSTP